MLHKAVCQGCAVLLHMYTSLLQGSCNAGMLNWPRAACSCNVYRMHLLSHALVLVLCSASTQHTLQTTCRCTRAGCWRGNAAASCTYASHVAADVLCLPLTSLRSSCHPSASLPGQECHRLRLLPEPEPPAYRCGSVSMLQRLALRGHHIESVTSEVRMLRVHLPAKGST
jgi:hypothetical protein